MILDLKFQKVVHGLDRIGIVADDTDCAPPVVLLTR